MSFYSALVLAANTDLREPSEDAIRSLLMELELLDLSDPYPGFDTLVPGIRKLFDDAEAQAENPHFFRPDSISFGNEIEIANPDAAEVFTDKGYCLRFHGNGYPYPWALETIRERVIRTPKLERLRAVLQERFGGRFVIPRRADSILREAWIDGSDGWMWFCSESM